MLARTVLAAVAACLLVSAPAFADDPYGLASPWAPATWGSSRSSPAPDATSVSRDAPITRARELLTRARFLDDAATTDEKAATELVARLPNLRVAAKAARDRVERATGDERELLGARAEDLETDVIVSEAEIMFKRKTAADNRHAAHELRARAVKLVREAPASEEPQSSVAPASSICDPPFRFTADGRKVYRVECLK